MASVYITWDQATKLLAAFRPELTAIQAAEKTEILMPNGTKLKYRGNFWLLANYDGSLTKSKQLLANVGEAVNQGLNMGTCL